MSKQAGQVAVLAGARWHRSIADSVLSSPWAIAQDYAAQLRYQAATGAWANIEGGRPKAMDDEDEVAVMRLRVDEDDKPLYLSQGGICVVPIVGPVTKYASYWQRFFGGTSSEQIRRAFDAACGDSTMRAVLLHIDSPGGEVYGGFELAEHMLERRRAGVPLYARVSDVGASLGYTFASCAQEVWGNATATVGSIGVYRMLADSSKAYADAGYVMHLLRSGPNKGSGAEGVPVSAEELAVMQTEIDDLHAWMVAHIAAGRPKLARSMATVADGRVFVGARAVESGLLDGMCSMQSMLSRLQSLHGGGQGRTESRANGHAATGTMQRGASRTEIGLRDLLG
jgi:signal peptide peptidase SppA